MYSDQTESDQPHRGSPLAREERFDQDGVATVHSGEFPAIVPSADWVGRIVGPYKLLRVIGKGGGGIVYEAVQRAPLERKVAIKFFCTRGAQDSARLRCEIRAMAKLDHPGVVSIIEVGELDAASPYIVMKLVEGERIDNWIERYSPSYRQIADMMLSVAQAMQYVHRQSVLHRDLKPSNVLITSGAQPVIIDFGLAKYLEFDPEDSHTETGLTIGSIGYLAPELAEPDKARLTPAVDIYGLGAMLYRLLTGLPPTRTESWTACLDDLRYREPTPPRKFNRDIPRDLDSICIKCLEKSPADRYLSMAQVAADLRRFLQQVPVEARPVGALKRLIRWSDREPVVAFLATGILLLLILSGMTFAFLWRKSEENRLRVSRNLALAIRMLQLEEDEASLYLNSLPGSAEYRARRLESSIELLDELQQENPGDRFLQHRLGVAWFSLGALSKSPDGKTALNAYQNALAVFTRLAGAFPEAARYRFEIYHTMLAMGMVQWQIDQKSEAIANFQDALLILERLVREVPDEPDFKEALASQLSLVATHVYHDREFLNPELARSMASRAVEISRSLFESYPDRPDYLKQEIAAMKVLTSTAVLSGEISEARRLALTMLPLAKKLCVKQPESPENRETLALALSQAALLSIQSGDLDQAERLQRDAFRAIDQLATEFPEVDAYFFTRIQIQERFQQQLAFHQESARLTPVAPEDL